MYDSRFYIYSLDKKVRQKIFYQVSILEHKYLSLLYYFECKHHTCKEISVLTGYKEKKVKANIERAKRLIKAVATNNLPKPSNDLVNQVYKEILELYSASKVLSKYVYDVSKEKAPDYIYSDFPPLSDIEFELFLDDEEHLEPQIDAIIDKAKFKTR